MPAPPGAGIKKSRSRSNYGQYQSESIPKMLTTSFFSKFHFRTGKLTKTGNDSLQIVTFYQKKAYFKLRLIIPSPLEISPLQLKYFPENIRTVLGRFR